MRPTASLMALLGCLIALCLTGASCGSVTPTSAGAPDPTPQPATAGLLTQRRAAGIPDCPTSAAQAPVVPQGMPDITLDCLGESSRVRLAGLRGTPTVVNVWAQWCGPCREESGHLRRFHALAGGRVRMLGILYAEPDPALAIEFAQAAGWTWPQLVDATRAVAPGLKVAGPPTTVFVDASGRIVYTKSGAFRSEQEMVDATQRYLHVSIPDAGGR